MKKTLNKLGMLCYNSECFLPKIGKRTRMSTLNPSSHHHTRSHDQLFILESTVDLWYFDVHTDKVETGFSII